MPRVGGLLYRAPPRKRSSRPIESLRPPAVTGAYESEARTERDPYPPTRLLGGRSYLPVEREDAAEYQSCQPLRAARAYRGLARGDLPRSPLIAAEGESAHPYRSVRGQQPLYRRPPGRGGPGGPT